MHALHVLRKRTVSNSDGLYGAYDPSTALSFRTVTIRTDRTDRTNRNTLCCDVIMRCTLRMCSEYGPLATLTVCTECTIRQLLLTVRNSATVLDMTALKSAKNKQTPVLSAGNLLKPLPTCSGIAVILKNSGKTFING